MAPASRSALTILALAILLLGITALSLTDYTKRDLTETALNRIPDWTGEVEALKQSLARDTEALTQIIPAIAGIEDILNQPEPPTVTRRLATIMSSLTLSLNLDFMMLLSEANTVLYSTSTHEAINIKNALYSTTDTGALRPAADHLMHCAQSRCLALYLTKIADATGPNLYLAAGRSAQSLSDTFMDKTGLLLRFDFPDTRHEITRPTEEMPVIWNIVGPKRYLVAALGHQASWAGVDTFIAIDETDALTASMYRYLWYAGSILIISLAAWLVLIRDARKIHRQLHLARNLPLHHETRSTDSEIDQLASAWSAVGKKLTEAVGQVEDQKSQMETLVESITDNVVAREKSNQDSHEKSQYLARMSHELRTPLNAVVGIARLLSAKQNFKEDQHHLGQLIGSSMTLLQLIDQILDIEAMEYGEETPVETPFNIMELVFDLAETVFGLCEIPDNQCVIELNSTMPTQYLGDRRLVYKILLNLAANALNHTTAGRVVVRLQHLTGGYLSMEISDTGDGISEDLLDRLYEPFIRSSESSGSGLGLYIVKHCVDALHGAINVATQKGFGTTFTVTLPLSLADSAINLDGNDDLTEEVTTILSSSSTFGTNTHLDGVKATSYREGQLENPDFRDTYVALIRTCTSPIDWSSVSFLPAVAITYGNTTRPSALMMEAVNWSTNSRWQVSALQYTTRYDRPTLHVLIAEDDKITQSILREAYTLRGHTVRVFSDGQSAFNSITHEKYDVCILDNHMPLMTGLDIVEQFPESTAAPPPTWILVTADATTITRDRAHALGVSNICVKPIDPLELVALSEKTMSKEVNPYNDIDPIICDGAPINKPYIQSLDRSVVNLKDHLPALESETAIMLHTIEEAATDREYTQVWDTVHKLKGTASFFGGSSVATLCEEYLYSNKANQHRLLENGFTKQLKRRCNELVATLKT